MIKDQNKTKAQLIDELVKMRRQVYELKKSQTAVKQVEKELCRVGSIPSLILNNNLMGIAFVRNRIFEWVNPMFGRLLGMPPDRIVGSSTRLMYSTEEIYEENGHAIYTTLARGEWFELELDVPRSDGTIFTGRIVGKAFDPFLPQEGSLWIFEDITDRRKAEEKYRGIFDNAVMGIFHTTPNGRIIQANPALARILGYESPEEVVAAVTDLSRHMYVNPRKRAGFKRLMNKQHAVREHELRLVRKDGNTVLVSVSAHAVRDGAGKLLYYEGTIQDITERRRAEAALQVSENLYRAIFENTGAAMLIVDEDTTILLANAEFEKLSGYAKSDLEGKVSWTNFVVQEDLEEMLANYKQQRIDRYAVSQNCSFRFKNRRGHIKNIFLTSDIITGTKRSIASLTDITELKKMENDLRRSEEHLRSIVETSNVGIMTITAKGKILFANQQMSKMIGCTVQELIGTNYSDLVHPEENQNVADNISQLGDRSVGLLCVQRRYICRSGAVRWGYVSSSRLDLESGDYHVVAVITDVTQIKEMEKERDQLEKHLRQAQKMEAIGTLAGGIAHDFNNILASMMGFTEMAARESREDVRRKYHDRVLLACSRAKDLINQILSFSRRREQEQKPLNIKPILKETLSLLRATMPATIEINQDLCSEDAHVLADPTQIHQIIMNLCTNAAYAMREKGGLLNVQLSYIDILHPAFSPHPDLPPGSYLCLSVRDTGHGIDPAIREKIFDPFFSTKETHGGTGLGLSVVYGIVKSYDGAIDVESIVGKGAAFTIYLPVIGFENGGEGTKREKMDLSGHERILFVDDEEALVSMMQYYFESLGYSITATVSSVEALRIFNEAPGAFDLVITDMTMPKITGAELIRIFLEMRPNLPIILCTGYSDSINMAETRKLKIREVVFKPILLDDLGRLVRRILDN